eukprot:GEMP01011457.1.p1 GENE.GEMP01011457.1~~GEMP01011457.1.p1  ORF type:complete len:822 (+),score=160.59 GEMP01011457.1:124-2589(+)
MSEEAKEGMCHPGGGGLFLPLFGDSEHEWNDTLRIFLYLFGLLWSFMGVAIIADIFMAAIERITSVKTRIKISSCGRMVTVKVWNDTVANLTLMALGSSAPEILLSVIELFQNKITSGTLGPSTIVGSAAFNSFVISAVCVMAIPVGETRLVKETGVYLVTATFSIFAYLWLIVILLFITPDVVDVWEGVVTFLFFPLLVCLAYAADLGYFSKRGGKVRRKSYVVSALELTDEELAEKTAEIRRQYGILNDAAIARLLKASTDPPLSRAEFRINATRMLFRSKQAPTLHGSTKISSLRPSIIEQEHCSVRTTTVIEFMSSQFTVPENCGTVVVPVHRSGDVSSGTVKVQYETRDGTAKKKSDYVAQAGELIFAPNETEKKIEIAIVNDHVFELTEEFYVDLRNVVVVDGNCKAVVGDNAVAVVTIIDDDDPGVLAWDTDFSVVEETADACSQEARFEVTRRSGCTGIVSCKFHTENDTAIEPYDYEATSGVVTFADNQLSACVTVVIKSRGRYDTMEEFRLILTEPTGGVTFDANTDGGKTECIKTIRLVAHGQAKESLEKVRHMLQLNWDKYSLGTENWGEQFVAAWFVNGSREEQHSATIFDWTIHLISLPWKLFFALVPPTDYMDGWLCFFVALIFIAIVTVLIGDLASLFGCVCGIDDGITAITFVALGTSLPDLFASKSAALNSKTADASIGNITGSNSVNVFLGLGLPWMIGAIYWWANGKNDLWRTKYDDFYAVSSVKGTDTALFVVKANELWFSVAVYAGCSIIWMIILALRRKVLGAELGGPVKWKWITGVVFVGLWCVYVTASILYIKFAK